MLGVTRTPPLPLRPLSSGVGPERAGTLPTRSSEGDGRGYPHPTRPSPRGVLAWEGAAFCLSVKCFNEFVLVS